MDMKYNIKQKCQKSILQCVSGSNLNVAYYISILFVQDIKNLRLNVFYLMRIYLLFIRMG